MTWHLMSPWDSSWQRRENLGACLPWPFRMSFQSTRLENTSAATVTPFQYVTPAIMGLLLHWKVAYQRFAWSMREPLAALSLWILARLPRSSSITWLFLSILHVLARILGRWPPRHFVSVVNGLIQASLLRFHRHIRSWSFGRFILSCCLFYLQWSQACSWEWVADPLNLVVSSIIFGVHSCIFIYVTSIQLWLWD